MRIGRSRSWSSKVDFGTNRKGVCDVLLVINSNFVTLVLSCTASEIRRVIGWKLRIFPTPPLVVLCRPRSGGSRQNFRMKLSAQKLKEWSYCTVKTAWSYLQPFLTDPPVWRTDGQTDGQTDGWNCDSICALSIYAVARKNSNNNNNNSETWQCLWCCHHGTTIARVQPVHFMNSEQHQAVADLWIKPIDQL